MNLRGRLRALVTTILDEASRNPDFAERLDRALGEHSQSNRRSRVARPGNRRPPGPFDPYEVQGRGASELRRQLETLDIEQLKNIVAEHGMDASKLAMKWKSSDRLIELIIDTVASRSRKGEAFRGQDNE